MSFGTLLGIVNISDLMTVTWPKAAAGSGSVMGIANQHFSRQIRQKYEHIFIISNFRFKYNKKNVKETENTLH